MGWNTFGRSAAFAALAGLAVAPWLMVAGPLLGLRVALAVYLVALAATSVMVWAPALRRGLGAAMVAIVLGGSLACATHTISELVLCLAIVCGITRGGFLYRQPATRAVVLEVVLVSTGLLFARFLAGPSVLSVMLAVWGFLLIQSVFFLVGGMRLPTPAAAQRDAFDRAHERARALLDGSAI